MVTHIIFHVAYSIVIYFTDKHEKSAFNYKVIVNQVLIMYFYCI